VADVSAWSYRRAWSSQPRHVADARQFVSQRLRDQGLDRHVEVVCLVVSELATNAVVHALGPFAVSLGAATGL
jgi:anti-sigma regulatory factor (Ser/Thr protein kinase)